MPECVDCECPIVAACRPTLPCRASVAINLILLLKTQESTDDADLIYTELEHIVALDCSDQILPLQQRLIICPKAELELILVLAQCPVRKLAEVDWTIYLCHVVS
jgi:hypothetical protein